MSTEVNANDGDDLFRGFGIEISLEHEQDFLKVRETLQRIGIASKKEDKLYQSCHILHKQGRYAIVHFKELFALDGKPTNISEEDLGRRNVITKRLAEWGLVKVIRPEKLEEHSVPMSQIKIISFKDKSKWILETKYSIGKKI